MHKIAIKAPGTLERLLAGMETAHTGIDPFTRAMKSPIGPKLPAPHVEIAIPPGEKRLVRVVHPEHWEPPANQGELAMSWMDAAMGGKTYRTIRLPGGAYLEELVHPGTGPYSGRYKRQDGTMAKFSAYDVFMAKQAASLASLFGGDKDKGDELPERPKIDPEMLRDVLRARHVYNRTKLRHQQTFSKLQPKAKREILSAYDAYHDARERAVLAGQFHAGSY